jgi:hypothetical protein
MRKGDVPLVYLFFYQINLVQTIRHLLFPSHWLLAPHLTSLSRPAQNNLQFLDKQVRSTGKPVFVLFRIFFICSWSPSSGSHLDQSWMNSVIAGNGMRLTSVLMPQRDVPLSKETAVYAWFSYHVIIKYILISVYTLTCIINCKTEWEELVSGMAFIKLVRCITAVFI